MNQHIIEAQEDARKSGHHYLDLKADSLVFSPEELDKTTATTYHQARQQAFDEALELVGEDITHCGTSGSCGMCDRGLWKKCHVCGYINDTKAELREALLAKKNEV